MDPIEIIHRRLRAQRLAGERFGSPAEAVRGLGAVQAQELPEALWALAQRSGHPPVAEVDDAFAAGEFLRTHVLRPTWHFVAPEDIEWMLRLTAPRLGAGDRSRLRQLEVSEAMIERAAEVVEAAVAADGAITRAEWRALLAELGIETNSSQIGHISFHLELRGLVCSGPMKGGKYTYALLADRVRKRRDLEGDEALAELAGRYLASHAPATAADLAWWGGITLRTARRGIELCGDRFEAVEGADGGTWYLDPEAPAAEDAAGALMLGSFDELVVAYKDLRTVSRDRAPGKKLWVRPVLVDGRLVGTWKRRLQGDSVRIEFTTSGRLRRGEKEGLDAEAQRYAAHLGLEAEVTIVEGELVAAA